MNSRSKNFRVGHQVFNTETLLSNLQLEIKRLMNIQGSLTAKGLQESHPLMQSYTQMIQQRLNIIESLVQEAA
jgi:hypothetical protein